MTYINRHWGNLDDEVLSTIKAHPEWYDTIDDTDLLHTTFYDVVDENGNLLGFFGNAYWDSDAGSECHICYVFVKEEHRGNGLFKKMVKHTVNHNPEYKAILIGAKDGNELANAIYSKMFTFIAHDEEQKGNWRKKNDAHRRSDMAIHDAMRSDWRTRYSGRLGLDIHSEARKRQIE